MGKILQLDTHVADLIAAGEVVERPASVIKELMENAIDAGADKVTVEIKGGGMTYMRVTDNGGGIASEDTETAFLRHATSKLRDERGLEAISTLGFRGEALAAIAAVARLELLTREKGTDEGTSLTLEGGVVRAKTAAGCPEGTTMIVRDLFYNTPARLKFMKSDKAEGAAVSAQVISCALSHPEVSVRYLKDGKEECHTPGDGRMDSCIYSLFGRDFMKGLLEAKTSDDSVSVTGYVSTPDAARGNRSSQYYFVNGRPVKSKTLQAGLEQAYRNSLFTGRFPSCVLYITLRPCDVDVNVHPTKTEVKFVREHDVFDGVYYAALAALDNLKRLAAPALSQQQPIVSPPLSAEEVQLNEDRKEAENGQSKDFVVIESQQVTTADTRAADLMSGIKTGMNNSTSGRSSGGYQGGGGGYSSRNDMMRTASDALWGTAAPEKPASSFGTATAFGGYQSSGNSLSGRGAESSQLKDFANLSETSSIAPVRDETRLTYKTYTPVVSADQQPQDQLQLDSPALPDKLNYKLIGEALNTYILVERGDSLWLIDKHAAHERIHFDRLKLEKQSPMVQPLLQPLICTLGHEDTSLLLEHEAVFDQLGFVLEAFGEGALAVRQAPADMEQADYEPILGQAAQLLRRGGKPDDGFLYDELLHSVACKAAIKAGKASERAELEALIVKVLSGEVRYCPHGRPVATELTKAALDKSFKRI